MRKLFQRNGLTIVMLGLFAVFWAGHSVAGWLETSDDRERHGGAPVAWSDYVTSGEFLESTAEQSEFLSVGALVVLSIVLRERGSAQSKPVDASDDETGT